MLYRNSAIEVIRRD